MDFDGSSADFLSFDYLNEWNQFSQELRVTSQFSESFEFVAGLFYWDVDYEQRWDVLHLFSILAPFPVGTKGYAGQNQKTESKAAFFSGDYHFNEDWTLTVGARYTEEEKNFFGGGTVFYQPGDADPELSMTFTPFSGKWSEFTPKIGLSYQHNDDLMFYTSYAEGFKSGGFFGRQANFNTNPIYQPEYLESAELGMKNTLLEGRMIFNAAIFSNEYKDKQESILKQVTPTNVETVVENAARQSIFGYELEVQYQLTEAWNVKSNYGYIDVEYEGFVADLTGDNVLNPTNNDDLASRDTPENTFGINSTYSMDLGEGELKAYIAYRWRDEVETLIDNGVLGHLDSISNLDATLTYRWNDDKYRVSAFGRNITDEREVHVQNIGNLVTWGTWNEGASYGVEFSADF